MSKNNAMKKGFTLIELLVVLVIMGFLVAMVAPKLAGIVDSAVGTACDTNQERLRKIINVMANQKGKMPSGLMNMVVVNSSVTEINATATTAENLAVPFHTDGNSDNGAEFLSDEFVERFLPQIHRLNGAEADELKGMGVYSVNTLAKVTPKNGATTLAEVTNRSQYDVVEQGIVTGINEGTPVLMVGIGAAAAAANTFTASSSAQTAALDGSGVTVTDAALDISLAANAANSAVATGNFAIFPEAKNTARILFGVSNNGELVTSGLIDESGTCPGQLQNEDHFEWGNYLIVAPRLEATVDRLGDDFAIHGFALSEDNIILERSDKSEGYEHGAQGLSDLTTSCPEGHTWGAVAENYAAAIKLTTP